MLLIRLLFTSIVWMFGLLLRLGILGLVVLALLAIASPPLVRPESSEGAGARNAAVSDPVRTIRSR